MKTLFVSAMAMAMVAGFLTSNANACMSRVSERKLFVVNMEGEVIRALTGDLVRMTLSHPVIPGKVRTKFDESVVRPLTSVNVTPDGLVGVATNQYYFEVVGEGDATIKLGFVDGSGKTVKSVTQEVQAKQRPVMRGCN